MTEALLKPAVTPDVRCAQAQKRAVQLPLPLPGPYDYTVGPEADAVRGLIVRAPLGKSEMLGVVWGPAEGGVADDRLRRASPLEGHPRLPPCLCDFIDWVARYTLSAPGAALALALRAPGAFDPENRRPAFRIGLAQPGRMTPPRARVLALMADGLARTAADIAARAGVSPGVMQGLADAGALDSVTLPEFAPFPAPDPISRM